jgi:molybdopterin converting factor small subunit
MQVLIASALQSYTGQSRVEAQGATVDQVLADLDARYPGIRFRIIDEQGRIRRHIRFFHDGEMVHELSHTVRPDGELVIAQALSGG